MWTLPYSIHRPDQSLVGENTFSCQECQNQGNKRKACTKINVEARFECLWSVEAKESVHGVPQYEENHTHQAQPCLQNPVLKQEDVDKIHRTRNQEDSKQRPYRIIMLTVFQYCPEIVHGAVNTHTLRREWPYRQAQTYHCKHTREQEEDSLLTLYHELQFLWRVTEINIALNEFLCG